MRCAVSSLAIAVLITMAVQANAAGDPCYLANACGDQGANGMYNLELF